MERGRGQAATDARMAEIIVTDTTIDLAGAPVALARSLAKAGRMDEAAAVVVRLLDEQFGLAANSMEINSDIYSLNSLNGTFEAGGTPLFFKFHQEENEGAIAGEYYRARLLADAGLPVDLPLHASTETGRQILVYRRRTELRFADVLRRLDVTPDAAAEAEAIAAEDRLNAQLMAVFAFTLHPIAHEQSAAEPIHRLFHERLVTPGEPGQIGGRFATFYENKHFQFPGLTIEWRDLKDLTFVVNGVRYDRTLGELFDEAFVRLRTDQLAESGGLTAHGDAHNANVWYERPPFVPGGRLPEGESPGTSKDSSPAKLVMFDPAFAGTHVPALLAEVKTTFHNVFAHPLWLYEPGEAAKVFRAEVFRVGDTLRIDHDWTPSRVRLGLLESKAAHVWRPLLALLAKRGMLPPDWRRVVKLALFLCPTLVMNLRASAEGGSHNPISSAIGLATAACMGAEPDKPDALSALLEAVTPQG